MPSESVKCGLGSLPHRLVMKLSNEYIKFLEYYLDVLVKVDVHCHYPTGY